MPKFQTQKDMVLIHNYKLVQQTSKIDSKQFMNMFTQLLTFILFSCENPIKLVCVLKLQGYFK